MGIHIHTYWPGRGPRPADRPVTLHPAACCYCCLDCWLAEHTFYKSSSLPRLVGNAAPTTTTTTSTTTTTTTTTTNNNNSNNATKSADDKHNQLLEDISYGAEMSHVDLGFLETCEPWQVASYNFPSKIGGKPAWLNLENLPKPDELQCENCQKQLIFLCQIYAPIEDDDNNFHRTIYIFICRNSNCCQRNSNKNLKVFRNNLPRQNKFYSYDPPSEVEANREFTVDKWVKLCNLCGCFSEKQCSRCKLVNYCCRDHQIVDWKEQHKNECGCKDTDNTTRKLSKLLFPEYEIPIEPEELPTRIIDEDQELKKFNEIKQQSTLNDVDVNDLETHVCLDNDKVFLKFRKRIEINPEQILRYQRNGEPLWIANQPKPQQIPNCEYCGNCRQFEFQIMPQLLSLLNENDLDWGTLIVYTCKNNCNAENCYRREFIFKQDVTDDNNVS